MGSRVLGRSGLLLPELVTVPRLMYTLREHYRGAPGVRPYLLLLIKDFILTVSMSSQSAIAFERHYYSISLFLTLIAYNSSWDCQFMHFVALYDSVLKNQLFWGPFISAIIALVIY